MRWEPLFVILWSIVLLLPVDGIYQNESVKKWNKMSVRSQNPKEITAKFSDRRRIEAVIEENGIIINILDKRKIRHRHGSSSSRRPEYLRRWSSETERDMIKRIRCRRYNSGYYIPNRCTNYCNCPYLYSNYNCAPCPYRPIPTYIPPYIPSVIITCNCDPEGSLFDTCNSNGQCMCKPNYKGPKCKRCKTGFWKNAELGCVECLCDKNGSLSQNCDTETGKCTCKSGVGGDTCNACLDGYYGNITEGCQKCEPCDKKGHICDPNNGKCVCPPLTIGYNCERCVKNAWAFTPLIGCKNCSCSTTGSIKSQCGLNSGKCECKKGFEGEKCNTCSFGYYGYPNCRQCTCDPNGTIETEFSNGIARCDEDGNCRCKEYVEGEKCNRCKPGTFGLDKNNPKGCIQCFCFGRSDICTAVDYTWDQIHTDKVPYSKENCLFSSPCINLPKKFTGDLTLSYGGFLRIINPSTSEFFVRLTGNNVTIESSFSDDVKLDEMNWRMFRTSDKLLPDCNRELNRKCFMVILQNVSNIVIKTSSVEEIGEVLLDKAVMIPSAQRARTIEKCDCPKEYASFSCQDPNRGYYRHRLPHQDSLHTWVDRIIGIAKKCDCNGLSDTCDVQTGYCLNCQNFTNGPHCELCAEGYYKTSDAICMPCLCPSEKQNFAKNCTANTKMNHFVCHCKEGYTGKKCNKCDNGYFGKPQDIQGSCQKCNCNKFGSVAGTCDKTTGKCQCHPGFTGKQCDQCKSPRKYIHNGVCTPCDECTQILFNKIDDMSFQLNDTINSFEDGIQGPWKYLDGIENRFELLKVRYTRTEEQMKTFSRNFDDMRIYEDSSNNLFSALKKKANQLSNQIEKIQNTGEETQAIDKNITRLQNELDSYISELNKFGTSHLDVKNTLEKAKNLLRELDSSAKRFKTVEDYKSLFDYCDKILNHMKKVFKVKDFNIGNITQNVNDIKMRFDDLNNLSNFVRKQAKQIHMKNKENSLRYKELEKTILSLRDKFESIKNDVDVSHDKLKQASELIRKMNKLLDELFTSDLENYFDLLGEKQGSFTENAAEIEGKMNNIKEHVSFLQKTLGILKSQVNFTQEEWKKINAGESYENIVKGISEAESNVQEVRRILDKVDALMNPSDNDALLTQSSISLGISDRFKQRIINHMNQNDLRQRLDNVRYELDTLEREIYKSGININNFSALMHDMKHRLSCSKPNMQEMKDIIETASEISRNMTKIVSDVNTMRYVNEHNLTRPFNKYLNLTSKENTKKLNEQIYTKINEIERMNINSNLHNIIDRKNDILERNFENLNNIKNKIMALKANITFTAQRVNNLYLPISLLNCSRWYQMKNIGVFNSMRIKFNCSTCNLLRLEDNGQSITMKVIDGLFLLDWNENPVEVELDRDTITSVEIKRKQNNLYLTIQNQIIQIPENKLFHISSHDLIRVGDTSTSNSTGAGCIYELFFNEINVGLWNFMKSIGNCTACETEARGINDQGKVNTLYMEGSYSLYNVSTLNPQQFSVILNFRTFDENSLLFLAQEISNPCAFISLNLKGGQLDFYMRHNDNSTIISIPVEKKVNDGRENTINIALQYRHNKQYYDLTVNDLSFNRVKDVFRMNVFRIRQSRYFIGGVSPDFNSSCVPVNTTSFVGFLNHRSEKNLRTVVSYNTFPQIVEELNFYRAWFTGDGFLNMNTTTKYKRKMFTIYFEIFPVLNSSYVMNIEKVGRLVYRDRKIILELQNGQRIGSNVILNNFLNAINITIKEQECILGVNGEETTGNGVKLLKGDYVILNIGQDVNKEYSGYLGGLSNIYVDSRNVNFNSSTILDFKQVEIGRWRTPETTQDDPTNLIIPDNPDTMQNTQGCFPALPQQMDPAAIKFGDRTPSYLHRRNSFWRRNFTAELQFRTLNQDGLILISTGSQPRVQYNVLEIRKGILRYSVKGKRKPFIIIFDAQVDDGEWHTVKIEQQSIKKRKKLQITLDGRMQKPAKIPKSNVRNEFYLGNVPDNFTAKDIHIEQFIGCIRNFKINNVPQLNTKDFSDYMNLGSCFPRVEKGAYFGGDSYAIYKRDFQINKQLEFSFHFKTSEHNGIILSISNSGNSPALSIEMQSGGLVMSVDLGSSQVLSVTNNLNSDYALCNNKWHNVTARYSMYELTVIIDGIARSWARYDANTLGDYIEAPLYIGGLPDAAPSGTLKTKENFKGCLSNLKFGELDVNIDWAEMEELHMVSLNSCPRVE